MSVREYIQQGYDGYEALKETEYINNADDEVQLITIMLEFFDILRKKPNNLRKNNLNDIDFKFGFDKDLKILDYIEKVTQEKNGILGLNLNLGLNFNKDIDLDFKGFISCNKI
jgi:hypothetical protein